MRFHDADDAQEFLGKFTLSSCQRRSCSSTKCALIFVGSTVVYRISNINCAKRHGFFAAN
jgi:hypothetical protein